MFTRRVAAVLLTVTIAAPFLVAASKEKTTDKGSSANLSFTVIKPLPCAGGSPGEQTMNVLVVARQNVFRIDSGTKVATQALELFISSFETCTFQSQGLSGVALEPSYSQVKVSSATAAASVALFDTMTGAPAGNAAVNLSFASSEEPTRTTTIDRFISPNLSVSIRISGTFADATASGSLVVGGVDLMPLAQDSVASLGTGVVGAQTKIRT